MSQFLDADLARSRAENLELEARGKHILHRDGVVRALGYLNHANMGNYRVANAEFLDGEDDDAGYYRDAPGGTAPLRVRLEHGAGDYEQYRRIWAPGLERWA